jgi:hypothetical protein
MNPIETVGHLAQGIYRVRRRKLFGPGLHYGVLSVGVLAAGVIEVIDLGTKGFDRRGFQEWAHGKGVDVVGQCPDHEIPIAIGRLRDAVERNGGYHLWTNNCEHFATWVVAGIRRSAQVDGVADVLIVAGVTVAVIGGIALAARAIKSQ